MTVALTIEHSRFTPERIVVREGTTFTFDEPGTFVFACHLPGHLA